MCLRPRRPVPALEGTQGRSDNARVRGGRQAAHDAGQHAVRQGCREGTGPGRARLPRAAFSAERGERIGPHTPGGVGQQFQVCLLDAIVLEMVREGAARGRAHGRMTQGHQQDRW